MIKRPVESGWGGDGVVCADPVDDDRRGSGERAQHESVPRPAGRVGRGPGRETVPAPKTRLMFSYLVCRNRLSSPVTPIEAA